MIDSGGQAAMPAWREHFGRAAPHLEIHDMNDHDIPVDDVHYALAWKPVPGRLASLPNLRLILSSGAGVDGILSDPHWPQHIPLVRMGGEDTAQRMTEYVSLGALSLLRDMPRIIAAQRARRWEKFDPEHSAATTRVGMMGLGQLGGSAAQALLRLGFQVQGWSRTPRSLPGITCFTDLDAFLATTDILVCLLPDTAETRGIVNAGLLAKLPRGAGIVNAARGTHVVIPDLLAALDSGQVGGAMLDVFDPEPLPPDSPVWDHPRIIVTPHTASLAPMAARARYVADAIAAFECGAELPNLYDPTRGY